MHFFAIDYEMNFNALAPSHSHYRYSITLHISTKIVSHFISLSTTKYHQIKAHRDLLKPTKSSSLYSQPYTEGNHSFFYFQLKFSMPAKSLENDSNFYTQIQIWSTCLPKKDQPLLSLNVERERFGWILMKSPKFQMPTLVRTLSPHSLITLFTRTKHP